MIKKTTHLLHHAYINRYAVGAFNVYNLEGTRAVIESAQELESPVILQILPSALKIGKEALIQMCLAAASSSSVPVAVHLDHCSQKDTIKFALDNNISSVMADGSHLDFQSNLDFTLEIVKLAKKYGAGVEGELGKITGNEDGVESNNRVEEMTDPEQAMEFVQKTGVDALAVCIGNIHGRYETPPVLDFNLLDQIKNKLDHPLVLHGSSGLPDEMINKAMDSGVCKFNVNTEVRSVYLKKLSCLFKQKSSPELIDIMAQSIDAMKLPVKEKIMLFKSKEKAGDIY